MKTWLLIILNLIICHFDLQGQKQDSILAFHLLDSAQMMCQTGNYQKALEYAQKSLNIRKDNFGNRHLQVADAYHALGIIYWKYGKTEEAIECLREVLAIRKEKLGNDHPMVGATLNDIGLTFLEKGLFDEAFTYFEKALGIQLTHPGDRHSNMADSYTNIGIVYYRQGNFDEALNYFHKALSIRVTAESSPSEKILASYNNIGVLHWEKKEYDLALDYYQKALSLQQQLLGSYHPDVAASYNNIALVYDALGRFDMAVEFNEKALGIRLKSLDVNHPEIARSYENIGVAFRKSGQLSKAETNLRKALSIRLQTLGEQHPETGYSYRQLGMILKEKGQLDQALGLYKKALAIQLATLPAGHPELVTTYHEIGKMYELKKTLGYALDNYEKAIACLDEMRKNYSAATTRQRHLDNNYSIFESAIQALQSAHQSDPTRFDLKKSFTYIEKAKANLLRDALNKLQAESFAGIPDSLLQNERHLKAAIAEDEKRQFEAIGVPDSTNSHYPDSLFELQRKHKLLIRQFEEEYPDYYRLKYDAAVITVEEVQLRLAEGQALVDFFVGAQAIYVFIIAKRKFRLEILKKDFPLEVWVDDLRKGIVNYFRSHQPSEALYDQYNALFIKNAFQLYNKLIRPLGELPEKLIIITDDVLGYIPFEILLSELPAENHHFATHAYLLRQHQFSYNFSATLWQEMQDQVSTAHRTVIMAPAFSESQEPLASSSPMRKELEALFFNQKEGETLQKLTGGRLLQGLEANVEHFYLLAPSSGILHLATHAKLNDRAVDYSFLALAGVAGETLYEKIFIRDLYNMRLSAKMVVLSACETSMGVLQRGEGIISLARGFAYAGAKSIITSLWSANDRSTAQIMELFYKNLQAGLSKEEALQRAKLSYLDKQQDSLDAHPFYWATFVGVGDMEAIRFGYNYWWIWGIGGLLLLLWGGMIWKRELFVFR